MVHFLQHMQALTTDQWKWLQVTGWDLLRSGIVALCVFFLHRLGKKITEMPDRMTWKITDSVTNQMKDHLNKHEASDAQQFADTRKLIELEAARSRKEFGEALQNHIATMHPGHIHKGN